MPAKVKKNSAAYVEQIGVKNKGDKTSRAEGVTIVGGRVLSK